MTGALVFGFAVLVDPVLDAPPTEDAAEDAALPVSVRAAVATGVCVVGGANEVAGVEGGGQAGGTDVNFALAANAACMLASTVSAAAFAAAMRRGDAESLNGAGMTDGTVNGTGADAVGDAVGDVGPVAVVGARTALDGVVGLGGDPHCGVGVDGPTTTAGGAACESVGCENALSRSKAATAG